MKRLVLLLLVLGLVGGLGWGATKIKWVSRETWTFEDQAKIKAEQERKKDEETVEKIKQITADDKGEYAVAVYRLGDGSGYGFNQNEVMPARSVIKVPVIAAALENGPVSASVSSLLLKMGKQSNNAAQEKMVKILGMKAINDGITDLGMKNTNYEVNNTTVGDVVQMWRNLYQKDYWEEMKKNLTDSIFEDRIAAGIPEGIILVHKVGTDTTVWNDSGVIIPKITNDKLQITKPFILVILNKDVDLAEAKVTVPEVTKLIWDYETNR